MSRYIDADKLGIGKADRKAFTIPEYADGWNSAIEIIQNAPTADVVEVRHGYNKDFDYPSLFECSICGWSDYDTYTGDTSEYNFCPNCGAKMDGERRENGKF
jgi:hypothetical protein